MAHTNEILNDSVLDILGSQQLYKNQEEDDDYEEYYKINNIENPNNQKKSRSQLTLDDWADATVADFVEDYNDEDKDNEMSEKDNINEDELIDNESEENILSADDIGVLEELPSDTELANIASDNISFEDFEAIGEDSTNVENNENNENIEEDDDNIVDLSDFSLDNLSPEQEEQSIEDDISTDTSDLNIDEFTIDESINADTIQDDNLADNFSIDTSEFNLDDLSPVKETDALQEDNDSKDLSDNFDDITPNEEVPQAQDIEEENSIDLSEFNVEEFSSPNDETVENISEETQVDLSEFSLEDISANDEENLEEIGDINTNDTVLEDGNMGFEEITEESSLEPEPNKPSEDNVPDNTEASFDLVENLEDSNNAIDFSLPELTPTEDMPFFEEMNEVQEEVPSQVNTELTEDLVQDENFAALDEISQSISFDDETPQLEELSLEGNIEEIQNFDEVQEDTSLQLEDIAQDVSFDVQNIEPFTTDVDNTSQEINKVAQESQSNNNSDDDMSGLEEFTMDMAAEAEKANPNILKSDFAANTDETPKGTTPLESFVLDDEDGKEEPKVSQNDSEYNVQSLDSFDFDVLNDNSDNNSASESFDLELQSANDLNIDDINLDELDDIDSEDAPQTSNDELNTDGIDVDNIDIDSLDIDNIDVSNINVDDIDISDIDINNIDDTNISQGNLDDMGSLNNIPEVGTEQDMQSQMGEEINPNQYNPDFANNDQSTIETLYQENQNPMGGDNLDNSFDQNNINMQQPPENIKKKKKTSPLLGLVLIALIVAFGFTKKDMIMEKINANKAMPVQEEQNMPIEGETQEDKEDQELLNDNSTDDEEKPAEEKQAIGEIPGEAGGPQDAASMEASLKQNKVENISNANYARTPEPLASSEIKRLYWEVPQDLTYNQSIVNYLKTIGRTMKLAIQSDLLNTTEMPYSNKMIVNIEIKKDGTADNVSTTVSSGSKQIDSIVLQTVKAALKYVKAPTAEFKNDSYNFSLIINF